jgi:bisphosphoglycerate-independent phosphoglycerate mutase (AlkP superfamily)
MLALSATLLAASCSSDETTSVPFEIPDFGPGPAHGEAVKDPNPKTVRKVLFIAIDGLRADKLDNNDGDRLTIPNFEALQRDGIFVLESHQERVDFFGGYRTCPGFIQMTTGKRIAAHGVKGNNDCENGRFADYPIFFKRLKQMRANIRIAVAERTSQVAQIIVGSCGISTVQACADEFKWFAETYAGDLAGRDLVLQWMAGGRYDVLWYHPHEVDNEGHESGWDDDPIDEVIEKLDEDIIGRLRQAVATRESQTPERWMVIVTADHGGHDTWFGIEGNHTTDDRDKKVPIIVSGTLIPNEGDKGLNAFHTWDLPATIYDYLGLTPNPVWPSTDGTSILNTP